VNAVRGDDDIGRGGPAVRERHPSTALVLLKADAAVPGMDDFRRQGVSQDRDEVGAMHPERSVPAG
jgi:hypothetical protein